MLLISNSVVSQQFYLPLCDWKGRFWKSKIWPNLCINHVRSGKSKRKRIRLFMPWRKCPNLGTFPLNSIRWTILVLLRRKVSIQLWMKDNSSVIWNTRRYISGFPLNCVSFIVNMIYAFQDRENLYLVMDLMPGGDLRHHISKHRRFTEEQTSKKRVCL